MMVTEDYHLKLIDFGTIAHKSSSYNYFETIYGTPDYMAPEI
jgi:serine/threonine protein kinase